MANVLASAAAWRSREPTAMDAKGTLAFANRLMQEVWEPFNAQAVPQFYRRDVVGYHRKQRLTYDDVINRLVYDRAQFGNAVYNVQDIVAAEDKFAIRFSYSAIILSTAQTI